MRQLHKAIRYIFTAENLLLEKIKESSDQQLDNISKEIQSHTDTLASGIKFSYSYMSEQATEFIPANETMDRKAFVIKGFVHAIEKRSSLIEDLEKDLESIISMYDLAHEIAVEKNELIIANFISNRSNTYRQHHSIVENMNKQTKEMA
jgi:hypothetical protein